MGRQDQGAGTNRIEIEGVKELGGAEHTVIPDRIEAGTFLVAGAMAAKGGITLKRVDARSPDRGDRCAGEMRLPVERHQDTITAAPPIPTEGLRTSPPSPTPASPPTCRRRCARCSRCHPGH
jgi:UDP-N-acetylglucosamine 1-carboxyvinyltransferase